MLLSGSPPTDLAISLNYVDENQPVGTIVGKFIATDPDPKPTFTYGLVTGVGGADNRFFTIVGSELTTKSVLDYEAGKHSYSILVRATDDTGLWLDKALSISLNDVNEAPTAVSHGYAVLQNTQLAVEPPGVLQGASDPEHDSFTATIATQANHGTVSVNPDGSFVYQPTQNYAGSDQFTYQAFDGQLYSAPATVTITVDYGADPVVQAPSLVIGSNNLVLARVEDNILLVSFANRQVLLNRLVSTLNSITVLGVDYRADALTIDASVSGPGGLPMGVTFKGGNGAQADTLVLRGATGADEFAVTADSAAINSLVVGFSNVEQLVLEGGAGDDTYQISALPVSTTISDGKGADTLDFSAALSGVTIDLGKSSSQQIFADSSSTLAVKGTIENVIGSESADWIKGNSANNCIQGRGGNDTLFGVAGRNLLIGGAGKDTLRGGSGDDILIGGTTLYDDDSLALAAIMREWTSARSFRKRGDNLAAGINDPGAGLIKLQKGATVLDDAAERDDLFGGAGCDWFFDFFPDVAHDRGRNDR
jgi:VCBS repeat-containing protein